MRNNCFHYKIQNKGQSHSKPSVSYCGHSQCGPIHLPAWLLWVNSSLWSIVNLLTHWTNLVSRWAWEWSVGSASLLHNSAELLECPQDRSSAAPKRPPPGRTRTFTVDASALPRMEGVYCWVSGCPAWTLPFSNLHLLSIAAQPISPQNSV